MFLLEVADICKIREFKAWKKIVVYDLSWNNSKKCVNTKKIMCGVSNVFRIFYFQMYTQTTKTSAFIIKNVLKLMKIIPCLGAQRCKGDRVDTKIKIASFIHMLKPNKFSYKLQIF